MLGHRLITHLIKNNFARLSSIEMFSSSPFFALDPSRVNLLAYFCVEGKQRRLSYWQLALVSIAENDSHPRFCLKNGVPND